VEICFGQMYSSKCSRSEYSEKNFAKSVMVLYLINNQSSYIIYLFARLFQIIYKREEIIYST